MSATKPISLEPMRGDDEVLTTRSPIASTDDDSRGLRVCAQALIPNARSRGTRGIIRRGPSWIVGIVPLSMPSLIVR